METPDEVNLMKLLSKIHVQEAQKNLLLETLNKKELLQSKILSSLQPKIGRDFQNTEMNVRKTKILEEARKKLIRLAIEEKESELRKYTDEYNQRKQELLENSDDPNSCVNKLQKLMNALTKRLNKKMNKKMSFHLGCQQLTTTEFTTNKIQIKKKRKWTENRKKKNRLKYKAKAKARKAEKIKAVVDRIKERNFVVNLSIEEIPDGTYIFLAKGLGFIPAQKVDMQDLKYDTEEFLRKLGWKAFFKANPELQNNDLSGGLHNDIRVPGFSHANFTSPLLDEVKTKLLGWIANHKPKSPKPNLTPLELRGRKWIMDKIRNETLFVTKADKGGATLLMNYIDVKSAIEKELFDNQKFEKLERDREEQLAFVKDEVKSLVMYLSQRKLITDTDKTLIAGLNSNNRPKLAPEYQPEPPYAYPLFKLHKLSQDDITQKKIPPSRLVHASKYSPLYRMEKWTSPYLTKISREFCKEELFWTLRI